MLVYFYHQQGKYGGPAFEITQIKLNNTTEKDIDIKLNLFLKSNDDGGNLLELLFEEPNNNKTL